ncbi:MAG: hypothetical protein IKG93_03265 [Clostridiales bacterium]|nr:hypothetical protein [Clostridiales bacterium]
MSKCLAIYGASGGAKETFQVVNDIQKNSPRWSDVVFIDDTVPAGEFKGHKMMPYVEFKKCYSPETAEFHVALGEVEHKKMLSLRVMEDGFALASLIHPDAIIDEGATLGKGVQVKMGAHISSGVVLGDGTWVQAFATIREGTTVGAYSQISAKVSIGKDCQIGNTAFVGMHATVYDGVKIGDSAIIAMGATAVDDVAVEAVCVGNPGRIMMKNTTHRVFGG